MIAANKIVLALAVVAYLGSAQSAIAAEVRYRVIDLGTLGGPSSSAEGLNEYGKVVGRSGLSNGDRPRPFLYDNVMQNLTADSDREGRAHAINNRGQIVGDAETVTPESYLTYRAFLFENGTMTFLGTLGGAFSQATAINDSGQVVGQSQYLMPPRGPNIWIPEDEIPQIDERINHLHAFLFDNGVMRDLHEIAELPGPISYATDINDVGQIIGQYQTGEIDDFGFAIGQGFLYDDGETIDFSTLGGVSSHLSSINNNRVIVGYKDNENGESKAFRYADGLVTQLGSLGGGESIARDINNAGTIVGQARLPGLNPFGSSIWHAFLYEDSSMVDLNALIPANSGWILTDASGINSSGQIVGNGRFNGVNRAYMLTPVPEPSSMALLMLAIVLTCEANCFPRR